MIMRTAISLAALSAIAFSGSAFAAKKDPLADPAFQVTYADPIIERATPNGSICQPSSGYSELTSGQRAARVGDVLTIQLVERTQATKSNSASLDRSANIGIMPPSTGPIGRLFSSSDVTANGAQGFKGKGDAAQSNALTGQITVTVAKVMGNGTMLVRGQKQVSLNRGDEYIQISGIVRPSDVTPDNSVLSTRVADARITYTGRGEIARASRAGWLSRFFSIVSPF